MIKKSPRRYVGGELTARIQRSQGHSNPRFQERNREGDNFHRVIRFCQVAKVTIDVGRAERGGFSHQSGRAANR